MIKITINNVKMAPPASPMIIKPEISLFRDGRWSNACENMMEKILVYGTPSHKLLQEFIHMRKQYWGQHYTKL